MLRSKARLLLHCTALHCNDRIIGLLVLVACAWLVLDRSLAYRDMTNIWLGAWQLVAWLRWLEGGAARFTRNCISRIRLRCWWLPVFQNDARARARAGARACTASWHRIAPRRLADWLAVASPLTVPWLGGWLVLWRWALALVSGLLSRSPG
jgi:hypothetical protein